MAHRVRNAKMRMCPKFRSNRSKNDRNIAIFLIWRWQPSAILDFYKFKLNGQHVGGTKYVYPYQISLQSIEPLLRYGDFSVFYDSGRRHLGFLNFWNFNGRDAQDSRTASSCQIWLKSVEPRPRHGDFSIFPIWRPSAILDLWFVYSDHPWRAVGGLYHCAKFGWNRCSSFDNRLRKF